MDCLGVFLSSSILWVVIHPEPEISEGARGFPDPIATAMASDEGLSHEASLSITPFKIPFKQEKRHE